jgi:hypothetical protein
VRNRTDEDNEGTAMASYLRDLNDLLRRAGYEARQNIPLALMLIAIAVVFLLKGIDLGLHSNESAKYALPGIVFFVAAIASLFQYLQLTRRASKAESTQSAPQTHPIHTESPADLKLAESVAQLLSSPGFTKEIEKTLADEQIKRFHLSQIRSMCDGMNQRLRDETYRLGSRANLNLSVGAVVCLTGFAVLGYYVVSESPVDLVRFAVRLSLVLFIEVFAYFFLNLYRAGLLDIKYFQNEITNATFRVMAIEMAFAKHDTATTKKLCEELARTERNFVLKKNETTHDLRQTELLLQQEKTLSSSMERIVSAIIRGERPSHPKREDTA